MLCQIAYFKKLSSLSQLKVADTGKDILLVIGQQA